MVTRKKTIPALVYRGTPVGFGAIPSGTINSGQFVRVTSFGILSGADYNPSTNNIVPVVEVISAQDVKNSGTESGTLYRPIGIALGDAPIQATYQQLQMGKPLADPTNVTQYTIDTDTDVRRMAIITPNDAVQVWLPYSGSAPSAGDYLTLSSGVDGCVQVSSDVVNDFTVGIVQGYVTDTSFSGVTVTGIDKYVLTTLNFKYGGGT